PMAGAQSTTEWARELPVSEPVRLGEIEAALLSRPVPDSAASTGGGSAVRGVTGLLVVVLGLLLVGARVIGLLAVLAQASVDGPSVASGWLPVAGYAFIISICVSLILVGVWVGVNDRRRRRWDLPMLGLTAVLAIISVLVLRTIGDVEGAGRLLILSAVAAVAALGGFLVLLFASKPPADSTASAASSVEEQHPGPGEKQLLRARAEVLRVLLERRLIDADTAMQASKMPLRSWHRLDESSQVD